MVFTWSYSISSLLDQDFVRFQGALKSPEVGVLSMDSRFGRVFDWTTHWKNLEGQTVVFLKLGTGEPNEYSSYFLNSKVSTLSFEGSELLVIQGSGFRARQFWLEKVRPALDLFYPHFLPGKCSIREEFHVD